MEFFLHSKDTLLCHAYFILLAFSSKCSIKGDKGVCGLLTKSAGWWQTTVFIGGNFLNFLTGAAVSVGADILVHYLLFSKCFADFSETLVRNSEVPLKAMEKS